MSVQKTYTFRNRNLNFLLRNNYLKSEYNETSINEHRPITLSLITLAQLSQASNIFITI